jgi:hypothetical protein
MESAKRNARQIRFNLPTIEAIKRLASCPTIGGNAGPIKTEWLLAVRGREPARKAAAGGAGERSSFEHKLERVRSFEGVPDA